MNTTLTPNETVRLCKLERVIQRGKETFVEVGNALAEIRDSRMYRATFKTFEDYCQERWGFSRMRAHQMIDAARAVENVKHVLQTAPQNARQAAELAKVPAEKQPEAWSKAQEKADEEGKPVAARHVEAAVAEVMEPETVVVDGSKGDNGEERYRPSQALEIASIAIAQLERINRSDTQKREAFKRVIKYCEKRMK